MESGTSEESTLLNLNISEIETSIYETIKDIACSSALNKPSQKPGLQASKEQKYFVDSYYRKTRSVGIMDDYYCKICKAHMNSQDMWESHISGKRHLKNVKKELEAPHPPRQEKDNEDPCNKRSYSSASEATSSGYKIRQRSRSPYSDSSRRYLRDTLRKKARSSPADGKWRHDRYHLLEQSPPAPCRSSTMHESRLHRLAENLSASDKLNLLKKVSQNFIVVSDNDAKQVKDVIKSLFQEYLLTRIEKLPCSGRNDELNEILEAFSEVEKLSALIRVNMDSI